MSFLTYKYILRQLTNMKKVKIPKYKIIACSVQCKQTMEFVLKNICDFNKRLLDQFILNWIFFKNINWINLNGLSYG